MINNNWHRKKRLTEQLKFFGANKTGFISEYARKPRIKVQANRSLPCDNRNLQDLLLNMSMTNGSQLAGLIGSSGQAQKQAATQQSLTCQQLAHESAMRGVNYRNQMHGIYGGLSGQGLAAASGRAFAPDSTNCNALIGAQAGVASGFVGNILKSL